ncbi:MAG: RhuM family protein [Candidatus Pacebacteria bacterium]|nr:RhuM family protein [Candidatus Paceibacterota bacterium]
MDKKQEKFNKGEIIIYQPKTGGPRFEVELNEETVWLNQKQMSFLFAKDVRTINEHIKNIFKEGELSEKSVIRKSRITAADGKEYVTNFYNLDVIISVGYRVKSKQGTEFRIWASKVLKDHLIKGYTLNQKRLKETNLIDLEQAVEMVKHALETKKLKGAEVKGLLEVITKYAQSWVLLQKYDEEKLSLPAKLTKPKYQFDYEEAIVDISKLKSDLLNKKQAADLFGTEREKALAGIIGNIYQTFGNKELYPSIEAKAAHLLYFIIKDHPFIDGNKRIGSFLFIVFLSKNNYLLDKKGERKFNDNALVALALLIAASDPKQKEILIKLVINFLTS